MGDPVVVANVIRYFVQMTLGSKDVECIVDMTYLGGASRTAGATEVGKRVLDAWHTGLRTRQSADVSCQRVAWMDLNSDTGSIGSTTTGVGGTNVWPAAGGRAENSQASNVAVRVNKNVSAIRGNHSGRMYVPGVTEPSTDTPNALNSSSLTAWQTAANTTLTALQSYVAPVDGGTADMVVVHLPAGGPNSSSFVTSLVVQQQLRSQGRRLR